jgi:putative membrane protein
MKIKTLQILPVGLITLASLVQACSSDHNNENADSSMAGHAMHHDTAAAESSDTMKNGTAVNKFLEQAAVGGMVEVEMGKIGQQKATMQGIKQFAAVIEKDHAQANAELKTLAASKGFELPAELPASKKEHLADLNNSKGKDFDNYYVNMMVEDHITDIALFEGATKSPDTAVAAFASKVLPVLQKHYKMAREFSMKFDQNKDKK